MIKFFTINMNRGFTIIETIIIITIITILSIVILIRWNNNPVKLEVAARKVAADIRYAQKLAITTQRKCGIFFISGSSYRIFRNDNIADPASSTGDKCSDDGVGNFVVDFSADRCNSFSGVTFTAMPTIYFNSIGTPVDAAGNPVGSDQVITLFYNDSKTITVTANTGKISY